MPLCERMKQISYGKQGDTKNRTQEVEVVADATLRAPVHPRKQMKCFADMVVRVLPRGLGFYMGKIHTVREYDPA